MPTKAKSQQTTKDLLLKFRQTAERQDLQDFVTMARSGKYTLTALCDRLDIPPYKGRDLLFRAQQAGYSVALMADEILNHLPSVPTLSEIPIVAPATSEGLIGVISDIHFGSKYCLTHFLRDFVDNFYNQGGRLIVCPGDVLQGCYRHSRWEDLPGLELQSENCIENLPQKPGLMYEAICGNHDETFDSAAGISVEKALPLYFREKGRTDFRMHGTRGAYLRIGGNEKKRGVLIELWHPRSKNAYAVSYHLQKHIEGYAVGQKPDILLAGHWHQQVYFTTRGVHAFSCGTFQSGQSSFGKSIGGSPAIGGWIIKYKQTEDGAIREMTPTWRGYYEVEKVRSIHLS